MRDGQQPESSYPFDPGRQNEPPTYGIAQDPTVGEQFNLRRTMRISSVLNYNAEVLADNGHNGADERLTVSIDSDNEPTLAEATGSGNTPAIWPSIEELLQASEQPQPGTTVERQRFGSVKTAQGRYDEYNTINQLLDEGGGGGLGQQERTTNSGAPPPLLVKTRIILPCGASELVTALLDTGARDGNVISLEKAKRWAAKTGRNGSKLEGTYTGQPVTGTVLRGYDGTEQSSYGQINLRAEISPSQVPIPAKLQFDFEAQVAPQLDDGIDVILGHTTLFTTGIIQAVVMSASESPQSFADSMQDPSLAEEEDFWAIPELDGFTMPTLHGTPQQRQQLQDLVLRYSRIFGAAPHGGSKMSQLDIKVKPGSKPSYQPPRRVSPAIRQIIREDFQMRVDNGWMIRAPNENARYGSPIVVAKQKDKYRVCTDLRAINLITEPCRHPTKDVRQTVEQCKGSRVFSKMDLRKGFLQLRLSEASQELLAAVTLDGVYRPLTAPFGEKSIPAEFQFRMSREVLAEGTGPEGETQDQLEGLGIECFIDDLLCHTVTFEQHLSLLERLFIRLDMYNLRLNGAKCSFGKAETEFLGFLVNEHGYTHTPERIQAILDIKRPVDSHQLKSLLGMANYMRSHCGSDYATLVQPLNAVSHSFRWGAEQQDAFDKLKERISQIGLLYFIDYDRPLHVAVDASEDGVGGYLYQYDADGQMRIAAYCSRAFTPTERKWSTLEMESYAVLFAVTKFDSWLLGHHFNLHSDHRNVLSLWTLQAPKVQRWRCKLSEYDFTIHHIPGVENKIPDALSRLHGEHNIYRICAQTRSSSIAINPDLVTSILQYHSTLTGHVGLHELLRRLEVAGFRDPKDKPGYLRRHCEYVLEQCALCQKIKEAKPDAQQAVKSIAVHEPGAEWSIDLAGPFPADKHGNTYICVAVDSFSRFVMAKAIKSTKAEETAQFILEIGATFGLPSSIRSDNARAPFLNELMTALLRLVNVDRKAAIAYLPRSNGIVERWIGELTKHLKYLVVGAGLKERWSDYLPLAVRILNATRTAGIGCAPAEIVFGGRVHLNRELLPLHVPQELADRITTIPDRTRRFEVKAYIDHLTQAQYRLIATANQWQDNVHHRGEIAAG